MANRPRAPRSPRVVLFVMCAGYFLVLLDVTVVNVALPRIGSDLGASVSDLQWVVDAYALALASLMLAGGAIGDLHGHKRLVLSGLLVFGLGSAACGAAPTVALLVVARAVQGVGAAMLLPSTLAVISRAFPQPRRQARAIGAWAGIGSLALPAGPLLGGALVDGLGWRAVFLVNIPIVAAAVVAAAAVVQETGESSGNRLDLAGVVLGVLVLGTISFGFIEGGRAGTGSPTVLTAAVAAVLLLAVFLVVERGRGDGAIVPLALFRRRPFAAANGAAAVMNLGSLGALFVLTLYLQSVQRRSPLLAGVALVPLFAPLALIPPLAGRLIARIGSRSPAAAGLALSAGGLALLAFADEHSPYVALLPGLLLWGSGLGVLTPAVVAAAIAAVPHERAGIASAVNNTARQAGGAIGIAVAGAVAGSPDRPSRFVHGLHAVVLAATALYLVTAVITYLRIPRAEIAHAAVRRRCR